MDDANYMFSNPDSIQCVLAHYDIFKSVSGAMIKKEKTKMLKFGSSLDLEHHESNTHDNMKLYGIEYSAYDGIHGEKTWAPIK
jgi:hypothetical protein